ncbi:MAG: AI-2E family transporter [Candidatus Moranbacteria bacterium]|nr:AI-2E family transporter [Candidatus Moranbacteria bacterium]
MTTNDQVVVGTKIVLRLALFVAGAYFLYLIRDVVLTVLFAVLAATALSPAIARLQSLRLSRTAAVIITYAIVFFGGTTILSFFLPLFFSEVKAFLLHWPEYIKRLDVFLSGAEAYLSAIGIDFEREQFFQNIEQGITDGLTNIFSTTVNLFQSFIHGIGFFFLALYLSLEEKGLEKFFLLLTPKEYHAQALSIAARMQGKVSQWLFGQLLLMLIAFALYYLGLSFLGIPYALAIAFFGGIMEIVPYIGPILAAIPAVFVGLLLSPTLGLFVLVFYIIAHQMEAHIIAPQVMKRSAGLNPVALIIAILIGAELAGPLGIILSVPLTMMLSVFVEDILVKRKDIV